MKKFLASFIGVMAIVALMATPSFAITSDGNATAGDGVTEVNTIAIEVISPTTGFTNDYNTIYFTLAANNTLTDSLTFALDSGASFSSASGLALCSDVTVGGVGAIRAATDIAQLTAPSTISGGGSTIQYNLAATAVGGGLPAGSYYIAKTCGAALAGDVFINLPSNMTVSSKVKLSVSSTNAGDASDSDTIYTAFQQFTVGAYSGAVGTVIDVNADLKLFTAAATSTTTTVSQFAQTFVNNAAGKTIVASSFGSANVVITITGDMDGISGIQLVNTGTTTQIAVFALGTGTATATINLQTLINTGAIDILYTIDTTSVKDVRSFNLEATVAPANDIVQGITVIDPAIPFLGVGAYTVGTPHPGLRSQVWTLNGMQFIVPYFRDSTDASFTTALRIENAAGGDRNYWILVNDPATGKWAIVASKVALAAGGVVSLSAGPGIAAAIATDVMDLAATAGITLSTAGYGVRVVIDETNNPQNIMGWAGQSIGSSIFRAVPVQRSGGFYE